MPNHVTHRIRVPAHCAETFKKYLTSWERGDRSEVNLDANKINPMPLILEGTEEGSASFVAEQLIRKNIHPVLDKTAPCVYSCDVDIIYPSSTVRVNEKQYTALMHIIEAHKQTGFMTWYEWQRANWGTEWGFYNTFIERDDENGLELTVQTAWSVPTGLFSRLAELEPSLEFQGEVFDEGWCFAGELYLSAGIFEFVETNATDEMYERVYGEPPEKDEVEDDEC